LCTLPLAFGLAGEAQAKQPAAPATVSPYRRRLIASGLLWLVALAAWGLWRLTGWLW
jgi:hypothetical protein